MIQDPVLAKVKMISESWDLGENGYQVGGFPPGWAEWNGRFRDHIRAYVKGDENKIDDFARNLLGSGDIFDRRGRRPWASVNFITAHDGFTLADLYAYNEKHNEANGEDNRDGHNENLSWNCGVEGPTDDAEVLELRDRMRRFAMTMLVVSQGVPMLLMGDENGRSQKGNNNAYCQDNELTWMDWSPEPREEAMRAFVTGALRLRRKLPLLGSPHWLRGDPVRGGRPARRALAPARRRADGAGGLAERSGAGADGGAGGGRRRRGADAVERRLRARRLRAAGDRVEGALAAAPRQRRRPDRPGGGARSPKAPR